MEAILQNKIRQKLNGILPSLSRFAMVLTGDEDAGDSLLAVFCARVMFTNILAVDSPDFTTRSFEELYKCWLEQIEAGVISTHIAEQESYVYRPGEFPSDQDMLILETGAFLVGLMPQDRAALLLVYGEGFTYGLAADILNVSEAELTYAISQACSKLAGSDSYAGQVKKTRKMPQAARPHSGFVTPETHDRHPKPSQESYKPKPIEMDKQGTFISNMKVG